MLERLQKKKSTFDITKWEKEESERQKILRRVSHMPRHERQGSRMKSIDNMSDSDLNDLKFNL